MGLVWPVSFAWLNETNQMNQTDLTRVLLTCVVLIDLAIYIHVRRKL